MADKKISQLTGASTPLAGTEVLPIVQSGSTVKVATDDLTVKNVRSNATTGILQVAGPGAGTTRVMTTPNANFTAARTDAAQTFTGENTFGDTAYTGFVKVVAGKGLAYILNTAVYMTPEDNIQGARIASGGSFKLIVGGSSEAINVDATSKDVKATAGNFVVGTAAKGIDFSANTPAAGMTSELLNWYEEGTWTPAVTGWTGITYIDQTGFYNRIGRQVTCWFYVRLTGTSAASAVTITGLPFSANTKSNGGALTYYDVAVNRDGILINPSGTTIRFYADADTGAVVNSDGNVTDKYLVGSVTYIV
jgi:hypothetical protein